MGAIPFSKYVSISDYLELESTSKEKHEYYQGEIFAMAGGSLAHNRMVRNALSSIDNFLKDKGCEVFPSHLKVHVKTESAFVYPDLTIICNGPQFYENRKDIITNPVIIIEVLSPDTRGFDRSDKFALYRAIPSLKEYLLIDSTKVHLEKFVKKSFNEWVLSEYKSFTDKIEIATINFETKLAEFYRNVLFEQKK